jgi:hypothetical protein
MIRPAARATKIRTEATTICVIWPTSPDPANWPGAGIAVNVGSGGKVAVGYRTAGVTRTIWVITVGVAVLVGTDVLVGLGVWVTVGV